MPLSIIRNDITKMHCDAIVNATNREMRPGGGVDGAIHKAAGADLFAMCQTLGGLEIGQAKITPAYHLPCKFIIHTAGPFWSGGENNERNLLESCYIESLKIAAASKCQSVAFPLISSGLHGYPKDNVLKVALTAIKQFLYENDMQVYLVLFDKDEYALNENVAKDIAAYIEKEYVAPKEYEEVKEYKGTKEYVEESKGSHFLFPSKAYIERSTYAPSAMGKRLFDDKEKDESYKPSKKQSVPDFAFEEDIFKDMYDGFALTLMKLIDEKGMDDVECYKKANVSRQTWNKILNDPRYKPNRKTIISFAIALELDIDETQRLLATAGFVLSKSSKFDLIIMCCIAQGMYDVLEIDSVLFKYDLETLSSKL